MDNERNTIKTNLGVCRWTKTCKLVEWLLKKHNVDKWIAQYAQCTEDTEDSYPRIEVESGKHKYSNTKYTLYIIVLKYKKITK